MTSVQPVAGAVLSPDRAADIVQAADESLDVIDRTLRLGSAALGCTLAFVRAETPEAALERPSLLPQVSFEVVEPVRGGDDENLGAVRALALAARPPFDLAERQSLQDVAAVIGALERRIGRSNHVTGLPNRMQFEQDMARRGVASSVGLTLMLVTLADARHYNEILRALGHVYAEGFVRAGAATVADRLGPGGPRLYHVSVLSFAFLADLDEEGAPALARDLADAFRRPVTCMNLPIATRAGVGLVRIGDAATSSAELLRAALAAAQDSRICPEGFAFYDQRSDAAHLRAFNLLTDLGEALRSRSQLSLAYQPRINLATGDADGAEALIRWTHPTLGAISPAEFVPLAETTALMGPLTEFVMETAFRQTAVWRDASRPVRMSINISPASLHEAGFVARSTAIMREMGVEPSEMEFEFTEGTITSGDPLVTAAIERLRCAGVTIAIDDFGTGYSNLDSLTRVPADVLKVDRSLIDPLDREPKHRRLVKSLIEMSHDLGFRVVAEGIESDAVYQLLAGWGCEEGQGFYMSRPLTPGAFAAFAFH